MVAYDVGCDRRRGRVQRLVEAHGWRVQFSVGVVVVADGVDGFAGRAGALLGDGDRLLVLPLCTGCELRWTGSPLQDLPGRVGVVR